MKSENAQWYQSTSASWAQPFPSFHKWFCDPVCVLRILLGAYPQRAHGSGSLHETLVSTHMEYVNAFADRLCF